MIDKNQISRWKTQLEKFANLLPDGKISVALRERGYWQKLDGIIQRWQLLGSAEAYDERNDLIEEVRLLNLEHAHLPHLFAS